MKMKLVNNVKRGSYYIVYNKTAVQKVPALTRHEGTLRDYNQLPQNNNICKSYYFKIKFIKINFIISLKLFLIDL